MESKKDLVIQLYSLMARIHLFELKLTEVSRLGVMPGFFHLCIGEEAVPAGVCANLNRDDYVTSTHRGHGHAIAKGVPLGPLFAEIWGKTNGTNKGRGGSMHIYAPEYGFLGSNGIVAAGIPQAAGAALTAHLAGTKQVAVSFFGDGATNNSAFHEGISLAAAWNLPVLFVCENNMYATETPYAKVTRNTEVAKRAVGYGIPGVAVDGNDVLAVYETARNAVEGARAGAGPTLIECKTYRTVGHSAGDPGTSYRAKEEIEAWKKRSPLGMVKQRAVEESLANLLIIAHSRAVCCWVLPIGELFSTATVTSSNLGK